MYRVLLVGASTDNSHIDLIEELSEMSDYIIAVDGGANYLYKAQVIPDGYCGDCDSIEQKTKDWLKAQNVEANIFDKDKDYTDLNLAFRIARKKISEAQDEEFEVVLTCVSGGRQDHNLAVFGCIAQNADLKPVVEETNYTAYVLSPDGVLNCEFDENFKSSQVSCIPLAQGCCISEKGMKWDLDHKELEALSDLGMSNVIESDCAEIVCHSGVVGVFLNM